MKLVINGKLETIENDSLAVTELLRLQNVAMPEMVSVELNGVMLNREEYEKTKVNDGDRIEFLYFMGGGTFSFETKAFGMNEELLRVSARIEDINDIIKDLKK